MYKLISITSTSPAPAPASTCMYSRTLYSRTKLSKLISKLRPVEPEAEYIHVRSYHCIGTTVSARVNGYHARGFTATHGARQRGKRRTQYR